MVARDIEVWLYHVTTWAYKNFLINNSINLLITSPFTDLLSIYFQKEALHSISSFISRRYMNIAFSSKLNLLAQIKQILYLKLEKVPVQKSVFLRISLNGSCFYKSKYYGHCGNFDAVFTFFWSPTYLNLTISLYSKGVSDFQDV